MHKTETDIKPASRIEDICPLSEDSLLNNKISILQPITGHRSGTDAVLLAASVPESGYLVDVGASTGAVGLMASLKSKNRPVWFVEQNEILGDICRRNVFNNNLDPSHVLTVSIFNKKTLAEQGLSALSADCVATNPPFFEAHTVRNSPDQGKSDAYILKEGTFKDWILACARLIKPKGYLCLIHKAEYVGEILETLSPLFGEINLRFIHPHEDKPAHRVVIRARKHSGAPIKIKFPLVLHTDQGTFTPEAASLHSGEKLSLFK